MIKIKEIILDQDSASELANEVAVSSVINFMKRDVTISAEDYDYLKKAIASEILLALGF